MKLIDTSAWVEFFRARGDVAVKRHVASLVQLDVAAFTCPVYFELLCGVKTHEKEDLEKTFDFCERVLFGPNDWEEAARLEQHLHAKGLTIPRNDLFVATVALRVRWKLVCRDRHFVQMRDKGGLSLDLEAI